MHIFGQLYVYAKSVCMYIKLYMYKRGFALHFQNFERGQCMLITSAHSITVDTQLHTTLERISTCTLIPEIVDCYLLLTLIIQCVHVHVPTSIVYLSVAFLVRMLPR